MEQSLKQQYDAVIKKAFWLAYEDNPKRVGWDLHTVDCDIEITNEDDFKPDAYYLPEVYMPQYLLNELYDITEGLPMFVDVYLSGRTSIENMLTVYTIENLEQLIKEAEQTVKLAEQKRNEFIERQEGVLV